MRSPSTAAFLATTFELSVLPPPLLISSARSTPPAPLTLRERQDFFFVIALSPAIVILHNDALFGNNSREYTSFRLVMEIWQELLC